LEKTNHWNSRKISLQGSPADARIAAARRLIDRRRYREALDVINDAIRIDPRKTDSFHLRSVVFENLGLYPQAEADRRRAAELEGLDGPVLETPPPQEDVEPPTEEDAVPVSVADDEEEPAVIDEPPLLVEETEPDRPAIPEPDEAEAVEESARGPRVAPVPRHLARSPAQGGGAEIARSLGTLLVILGLFAAFGVGIYIALSSISNALDGGGNDDGGGEASPTVDASGSATPTPGVSGGPLSGSPLDFEALSAGWATKGITATPGDANEDITGFAPTPVNVTLERAGEEMLVAVLLYPSAQGISQDWDLGDRPTPKAGREIPEGSTVWYNLNAVVVVLESNDALRQDALDGFLSVNA
jgi:hypothetical protein